MLQFFKFLQWMRKTYNKDKKKSLSISIVAIFVSAALCVIADMNLPEEKWSNFIKIIPVISLSLSLFFTTYSLHKNKKEEKRASLTFYQRVNISIVIITTLIISHLVFLRTTSPLYSLITALILCIIMWTIVFIRPFKHELDKAISELQEEDF